MVVKTSSKIKVKASKIREAKHSQARKSVNVLMLTSVITKGMAEDENLRKLILNLIENIIGDVSKRLGDLATIVDYATVHNTEVKDAIDKLGKIAFDDLSQK